MLFEALTFQLGSCGGLVVVPREKWTRGV
jgi:hypothetical protein